MARPASQRTADAQFEANQINKKVAEDNLEYQKEHNREVMDYQKAYDEKVMAREDTAIQRQASDARSAGISPLAMNGLGAASSGSNMSASVSAPHNDYHHQAIQYQDEFAERLANIKQMVDMTNSLISTVNSTTSTASSNALRSAQEALARQTYNDNEVSSPYRFSQLVYDQEMRKLALSDAYREDEYNNRYGVTRNMSEGERLVTRGLHALGIKTTKDLQRELSNGDTIRYSTPVDFTLRDVFNAYKAMNADPKKQNLTSSLDDVKNDLTKQAVDAMNQAVEKMSDNPIIKGYNKTIDWLKKHSVSNSSKRKASVWNGIQSGGR